MNSIKQSTANHPLYNPYSNPLPNVDSVIQTVAKSMSSHIRELKNAAKKLDSNTSTFNKKCNKALRSLAKVIKHPDSDYALGAVAKLGSRMGKIYQSSKFTALHEKDCFFINRVRTNLLVLNRELYNNLPT